MKSIKRKKYLNELISLRNNGMIKIITGMRRCGKSYLLFEIFTSYLETSGTAPDHIIKVDLEDYKNRTMRNPDNLTFMLSWKAVLLMMECIISCWTRFRCSTTSKMC